MSQAGVLDIEGNNPQIPTTFDGDSGSAVPILNTLELNGLTVANATYAKPLFVTASGMTVVHNIQVGAAITGAPADSNDAGLVSFDDTQFTVDSNGFVQLAPGSIAIDEVTGDDGTPVPGDGTGNINFLAATVANGTNTKPLYFAGSVGTNTQNLQLQIATTLGADPADFNDAGIASFNSTDFTISANGRVSLVGGAFGVLENQGDDGVAVAPNGSGIALWIGNAVANATHAKPVYFKDSATPNAIDLDIQVGAAVTGAPGDANDAGLVSVNDTQFTATANGYISLVGGADLPAVQTLTGDDAVATGPDGSGNIDLTGLTVANATNAKPVYVNGGTNSQVVEVQVGAAITGAPADSNDAGLVSFDDTTFAVDANGYVTLLASGNGVLTNTGDDAVAVSPDGAGDFGWIGNTVANATHAKPVYFKDSATANSLDLDVQVGAAVTGAPADANDAGLVSFDDTAFAVDANGYVTLVSTAVGQTITGDSGGALSPTAGNWNILGGTNIATSGSGSTLTVAIDGVVAEANGGTNQSTYSTGDILYASAANTLSKLAAGSDGEVLTLASGIPSWAAGGGGGGEWTLLDQYTLTGGETNVDFTDLSANEYMYFANSVVPSASAELQVFLSVDNGSTFETAYFYNRPANGSAMADSEPSYDNTTNTANTHWLIGSVSLVNLTGLSMGVIGQTRTGTVDDVKYCWLNVAGVVDAMRFSFSAGTFNASGVISVWGR